MNRKSGVILGIALIIFLVISIIGAALMTVVMGKARQTNDLEKRTQAYFFARSGVEIAREYVNEKRKNDEQFFDEKVIVLHGNISSENNGELSFDFQDVTDVWPKDNVRASFEASASSFRNNEIVTAVWRDNEYTNFLSSGNAGDMTRTLAFMCSEGSAGIPVFDMAIFADGKISIGSAQKVYGNVGTNSTITKGKNRAITIGGNNKITEGDVYFGNGANIDGMKAGDFTRDGTLCTLDSNRDYALLLPDFPETPELINKDDLEVDQDVSVNADGYYKKITVGNRKTLTFDTGNAENVRKIVVDEFEFGSDSSIKLSGEGKLNLYVGVFITTGNSSISINKEGDRKEIDRVVLYYSGNSLENVDLDLIGTFFIEGASDITLGQGNNELRVSGLIIYAGESDVTMKGIPETHTVALFAPKAKVIMSGNASFYGAIVCNEYSANGNPDVYYRSAEEIFSDTSLEIIDADGEEAFEQWGE